MIAMDVMTPDIVSIAPGASLQQAAKTMIEKSISALPVVEEGRLVGILSEGDLLRRVETKTERHRPRWVEALTRSSRLAEEYVKAHARNVGDVMTRDVVTVNSTADIAEVAKLLEARRIKRVPVMRDGKMVGIISRANLVQALAARPQPGSSESDRDRQIRDALLSELRKHRWADPSSANVVVHEGVVHLWGEAISESERAATRVAAENIGGVRRVDDHMSVRLPGGMANP